MTAEKILEEVQSAYRNREIRPYFQPQYDAVTCRIVGAEALARWIRPDGSMVMPGDYIPVLEQTDAIWELDWHMLREVCISLKEQQEMGIPCVRISVNFSRKHITDPDFVHSLCEIVDSYEVDHKMIEVEITESAMVDSSPQELEAFVDSIREKGFAVAIDDFGCGLSSLSTVKDVEVDTLKIDRSLLTRNCEDEKERIVLESILNFAHRLQLITVAEGVETKEQLAFLRTCGCKVIQGFLLAKPMPQKDFWDLCVKESLSDFDEDILKIQSPASATQLLLDAIYMKYPLIIYLNLTRDSYYIMLSQNFTTTGCLSTGTCEECISHGAATMHPEDRDIFINAFNRESLLAAYERGEKTVSVIVRQLGDDGIYRRVEVTDYFVKSPSVDDILVISLSHTVD